MAARVDRRNPAPAPTTVTSLPYPLRGRLEALSGIDLSGTRVHHDSPEPARVQAVAYAQGRDIHLGPGQGRHLAHEGWHVVQQRQGRVKPTGSRFRGIALNDDPALESEAARVADLVSDPARAVHQAGIASSGRPVHTGQPVQRMVRVGGGATKVNESRYQTGGAKATVGSRFKVADLIADHVRRVFTSETELDAFANGKTDHIGDVHTTGSHVFWYRLPPNRTTVLGEFHNNPRGTVEDVIRGVRTSRFMHEFIEERPDLATFNVPFRSTNERLEAETNRAWGASGLIDDVAFPPEMENAVIKALTDAQIFLNTFIPQRPRTMSAAARAPWSRAKRPGVQSFGALVAEVLSLAVIIARDVARHDFGAADIFESMFAVDARHLKAYYRRHQAVLDAFAQRVHDDEGIGIYELVAPDGFANLPVLEGFTSAFRNFGTSYIQRLGAETGNPALAAEGHALALNRGADLVGMDDVREEGLWAKIQQAATKNYLIVAVGDAHRRNLRRRLDRAGIRHDEVERSLWQQRAAVHAGWRW